MSAQDPPVEPGPPEEESRPFPDPTHDLTPRKPRTVGGVVYLCLLAATAASLAMIALDRWRSGLAVMGGSLLLGAVARLVIPNHQAGMLGIRRKLVDVLTLLGLGGGLLVLAFLIPGRPAP